MWLIKGYITAVISPETKNQGVLGFNSDVLIIVNILFTNAFFLQLFNLVKRWG